MILHVQIQFCVQTILSAHDVLKLYLPHTHSTDLSSISDKDFIN